MKGSGRESGMKLKVVFTAGADLNFLEGGGGIGGLNIQKKSVDLFV